MLLNLVNKYSFYVVGASVVTLITVALIAAGVENHCFSSENAISSWAFLPKLLPYGRPLYDKTYTILVLTPRSEYFNSCIASLR